jgi:glucose/arabinose dehydrogenase
MTDRLSLLLRHRLHGGRHRGSRTWSLGIALILALLPLVTAAAPMVQSGLPGESVASVPKPTALAFLPDGGLLITSQPGKLYLKPAGGGATTVALDLSAKVCANSERGLLGVAVDPDFWTTSNIYLYYTFKKHDSCPRDTRKTPVNRVSKFQLSNGVIDPQAETVLINNIPSPHGNHNAGDLHFGNDGNLYISVGDGACDLSNRDHCQGQNTNARRMYLLNGKILRITADGDIPNDNPFQGAGTARCNETGRTKSGTTCQEIFASGLRNPFRFAMDPNKTGIRFFINDVGLQTWEEIDDGQAKLNYGWNSREGHCVTGSATKCGEPPAGLTNPIFDYQHKTGCESITGGAFVPDGRWPAV